MGSFKVPRLTRSQRRRYHANRDEAYPTGEWDEETREEYDGYKEMGRTAHESGQEYERQFVSVAGNEATPLEDLDARQHGRLALPASEASLDSQSEAIARQRFLEERPYAYQNNRIRDEHEVYAQSAWDSSTYYRHRSNEHMRLSSSQVTQVDPEQKSSTTTAYYDDFQVATINDDSDDDDDDGVGDDDDTRDSDSSAENLRHNQRDQELENEYAEYDDDDDEDDENEDW